MKKIQVNKELDDAVEYFESSYHIVPTHDSETGLTRYARTRAPLFQNIRRLKRSRDDYRPGKVKVYTRAEIEEYEDARLK